MMCRFDLMVAAQETCRAATTVGGEIRDSGPEGLGGALHPHGGANAGTSAGMPMT